MPTRLRTVPQASPGRAHPSASGVAVRELPEHPQESGKLCRRGRADRTGKQFVFDAGITSLARIRENDSQKREERKASGITPSTLSSWGRKRMIAHSDHACAPPSKSRWTKQFPGRLGMRVVCARSKCRFAAATTCQELRDHFSALMSVRCDMCCQISGVVTDTEENSRPSAV